MLRWRLKEQEALLFLKKKKQKDFFMLGPGQYKFPGSSVMKVLRGWSQ
jgi:hypothetical protein